MDDWERQGSSKLLTQHSPSSTIPKVIMADAALAAAAAAAAALAAVPPRIPPLTMILENVLGFSAGQINAIRDEGYTDLEDEREKALRFKLVVERQDESNGSDSTR